MKHLEYARLVEETHGPHTQVTWMTVGELVDLLEQLESLTAPVLPDANLLVKTSDYGVTHGR